MPRATLERPRGAAQEDLADGSRSRAQAAIAFVLASSAVTSVVVGARSPEQLIENLAASA